VFNHNRTAFHVDVVTLSTTTRPWSGVGLLAPKKRALKNPLSCAKMPRMHLYSTSCTTTAQSASFSSSISAA